MKGRQVPVHDIKGGIHPDADAQRIKNNSWVKLENVEYDRQGRLVKVTDLDSCVGDFVGEIRDLKETDLGYLVAADQLQYASDILATAAVERIFNSYVRSKFGPAPNRAMYYIDSNHLLRRWSPDSDSGIDLQAGIPAPLVLPVAKQSLSAGNVWRVGVQDLVNNDDSLKMSIDVPGGGVNVTYRPKSYSSWGPTLTPELMFDGDPDTAGVILGINSSTKAQCVIYGFEVPEYSFAGLSLKVKHTSWVGDAVYYTLNSGISWILIDVMDGTFSVDLSPTQDISKIQVMWNQRSGSDPGSESNPVFTIYDVRIEASGGSSLSGSPTFEMLIKGVIPTVVGIEKFKALNIPIKTNGFTVAHDVVVTLTEYYGDTETVVRKASKTVTVAPEATFIQTPDFDDPFSLSTDGSRKLKIGLSYGGAGGSSDSLTFYRALPWFTQSTGRILMTSETAGEVIYTDREPLIAFRLISPLIDGQYDYAFSLRGQGGFEGNYTKTNSLTQVGGLTHYFFLEDFPLTLAEGGLFGTNTQVILNRTLSGGGTFYRLKEFDRAFIEEYVGYTDKFTGTWGMDSPLILPPNRIVDSYELGTATVSQDNADSPAELYFFYDTLAVFRSRLFGLVEIEDTSGQLTTFLRYSEVDVFDYWPPLNEVAIRDDLIGICPLREDMLLAFSETKTYRITPSGTSFDWVKIADVGLGSVRLVGATNEAVVFGNDFGLYVFDGSVVSIMAASNDVLSLIRTAVNNEGTLNVSQSLQKIFLSLHDAGEGTPSTVLLIDMFVKAITTIKAVSNLTMISDINKVSYFGFSSGALMYRGSTYSVTSIITSKRFASNDLNRIRLYYMGVRHLVEKGVIIVQ